MSRAKIIKTLVVSGKNGYTIKKRSFCYKKYKKKYINFPSNYAN